MMLPIAIVTTALVACALTGLVRRYALRRSILDVPNHRSSHTVPTPRGGGLAIAVVLLGGTAGATLAHVVAGPVGWAIVVGGTAVAAIGWLDDRRGVRASIRSLVHFAAAGWVVFEAGGLPTLRVGGLSIELGVVGGVLAAFAIVWLTNLYNFMDGIDGIAGVEAVIVGGMGGALALAAGDRSIATVALLTTGAAAGFLVWNWPPARIFMGDVGSGLLGFVFGALAILSERAGAVGVPAVLWLVLLGTFVGDATITLVRRVARGERWYEAHHSHAYQRAVQSGWTHRRTTLSVAGLDLLLAGLAAFAWTRPSATGYAVAAAIACVVASYLAVERRRGMRSAPRPAGDARDGSLAGS